MNIFFKWLSLAFFAFTPSLLYAQVDTSAINAISNDTTQIFNLPLTDPSLNFLQQLFGSVGPVLHGTSGQILGTLFEYFNLGILVVAGVFLIWTTVKVVISSSHEGSFMGRESKGAFNVIRTVVGIGLLTPSTGGYSVIQMFVMWTVLQGCGFANTVWTSALNYFQEGNQLFTPPSTQIAPLVNLAGTILEAQVCMYYSQKMEQYLQQDAKAQIAAGNTTPNYVTRAANFPTFQPTWDSASTKLSFPSSRGNSPTDSGCGMFIWSQNPSTNNAYVETAMRAVVDDLSSAAVRIVNPLASDNNSVPGPTGGSVSQLQDLVMTALVGAASDWFQYTMPIRTQNSSSSLQPGFFATAQSQGWIYAGTYYYQLASLQRKINNNVNVTYALVSPPACLPSSGGPMSFPLSAPTTGPCFSQKATYYSNSVSTADFGTKYAQASSFTGAAFTLAQAIQTQNAAVMMPDISYSAGVMGILLGPVTGGLSAAGSSLAGPGDPIMKLQSAGQTIIAMVLSVWITLAVAFFFLGLVSNLMSSMQPVGFAMKDALSIFIPILMALLMVLFTEGIMISIYVPLIPAIIYIFTVIGWFIAVIEAMAAAPLVALGVTHPEGHDFLGKAEQAVMLLLGVFLRPVLMVIGLIAGMLLSVIGLTILNSGMTQVISGSIGFGAFCGTFSIYCALVVQLVTQCYSLIYMVPDRVLRWLGQGVESGLVGQALQAAEGSEKGLADAAGKGMSEGMSASLKSGNQGGGDGDGGSTGGSGK